MLVYARNPNGIIHTGTYRIYGIGTGHAPSDIPYELYVQYKNVLVDATYREGYLAKLFKKPFPEVAFRYDELRYLPEKTLNKIATAMCIPFQDDWTPKRKVESIKTILRNESPSL